MASFKGRTPAEAGCVRMNSAASGNQPEAVFALNILFKRRCIHGCYRTEESYCC